MVFSLSPARPRAPWFFRPTLETLEARCLLSFVEFTIPTANSSPAGIITGPDGNLWFTEHATNKIGRISPAGVITEFSIPTANSVPEGITAGPDGNLWFTETNANKIGRITPAGAFMEFSIPTANSEPFAITAGPDGNLWFTEFAGNKIAKVTTVWIFSRSRPTAGRPRLRRGCIRSSGRLKGPPRFSTSSRRGSARNNQIRARQACAANTRRPTRHALQASRTESAKSASPTSTEGRSTFLTPKDNIAEVRAAPGPLTARLSRRAGCIASRMAPVGAAS